MNYSEIFHANIIEGLDNKSLLPKDLKDIDYTDFLRLGTYNNYGKELLQRIMDLKPVALLPPYKILQHQVESLRWMYARERNSVYGMNGGILSLDMGLGKTLIALIHLLSNKGKYPALVVASKTVINEWKLQIEKFFGGGIRAIYVHKDYMGTAINKLNRKQILKADVVLTTYDICVSLCKKHEFHKDILVLGTERIFKDKVMVINCKERNSADNSELTGPSVIYGTPWERVICDESQRFANPKTMVYKAMMALYGKYKWCLSGTVIKNYDTDVWAQMRFIGYTKIERSVDWKKYGRNAFKTDNLNSVILRMSYEDANVYLPPRNSNELCMPFTSDEEQLVYEYVQSYAKSMYDMMLSKLISFANILAVFTRLRQCCIAPYIMTQEAKRSKDGTEDPAVKILASLEKSDAILSKCVYDKKGPCGMGSTKVMATLDIISRVPEDEKIIIFSSFTSCLDLIIDSMRDLLPDIKYEQVDGMCTGEERNAILERFRSEPEVRCLFMTYKTGSEGLNLVEARHCICVESWWNTATHLQAIHRVWRNGQTKEVETYNVHMKDTIEDRMREICEEKETMAQKFLDGTNKKIERLDKYTLGRILGIYN